MNIVKVLLVAASIALTACGQADFGTCKPKIDISKGIEITLPHAKDYVSGESTSISYFDNSIGHLVLNFDRSIQGQESLSNFQAKFKDVAGHIVTDNYISCPSSSLSDFQFNGTNPQISFESFSNNTLKGTYTVDLKSIYYWKHNSKDPGCVSGDVIGECVVTAPFVTRATIHFDIGI